MYIVSCPASVIFRGGFEINEKVQFVGVEINGSFVVAGGRVMHMGDYCSITFSQILNLY